LPGTNDYRRHVQTDYGNRMRAAMSTLCPEGYKFVLLNKLGRYDGAAGGWARMPADPPALRAALNDRQLIASLTKIVTGAAILNRLQAKGISPNEPLHKFLPPGFKPSPQFKTLTILNFLNHKTGFTQAHQPGGGTSYAEIKDIVGKTPIAPAPAQPVYLRFNYAIMRLVLPGLDLYDPGSKKVLWPAPAPGAEYFAERYIALVNQHVLAPLGIPTADCRPDTLSPTDKLAAAFGKKYPVLCYPPNPQGAKGAASIDYTQDAGAGGWFLSVEEMGKILHGLYFGTAILNPQSKKLMFRDPWVNGEYGAGAWCTAVGNRQAFQHSGGVPFGGGSFLSQYYIFPPEGIIFVGLTNGAQPGIGQWENKAKTEFVASYGPG